MTPERLKSLALILTRISHKYPGIRNVCQPRHKPLELWHLGYQVGSLERRIERLFIPIRLGTSRNLNLTASLNKLSDIREKSSDFRNLRIGWHLIRHSILFLRASLQNNGYIVSSQHLWGGTETTGWDCRIRARKHPATQERHRCAPAYRPMYGLRGASRNASCWFHPTV